MDLAQITKRISAVNAESKRLNNERQINIGKKSTLTTQLNEAIKAYSQTYGVDLTVENIQAELTKVAGEKEHEVANIENVLSMIKAGNYKEAEKLMSGNTQESLQSEQTPLSTLQTERVLPEIPGQVLDLAQQVAQHTPTGEQTPLDILQAGLPGQMESRTQTAVPPQIQSEVPVPPVISKPSNNQGLSGLDVGNKPKLSGLDMSVADTPAEDDIPAPPPVFQPKKPVTQAEQIKSFNAILGNKAFNPQG